MKGEPRRGPDVVARGLLVRYGGRGSDALGLRGLDACFGPGITGLVGPNGAGKSTFLRAASGLLPPSRGWLTVGGLAPSAYAATQGLGYLPEDPPLPRYLTVRELLAGIPPAGGRSALCEANRGPGLPGLAELLDRSIGALSHGQRRKAALAAALVGDPRLLLLDEPTNGLDPLAVRELREVLRGLGREERTVVVSSHHLDELQRIADTLVFVGGGVVMGRWTRQEALAEFESFDGLFEHAFRGGIQ